MNGLRKPWRMLMLTSCLLSCNLALIGCTKHVVMPSDRQLQTVYAENGQRVEGRVSISTGYLQSILKEMQYAIEDCSPPN